MIEISFYGFVFLIYCAFVLITFDMYSKKQEVTNPMVLVMIYVYYSILGGYVVSVMETTGDFFILFIEIAIYIIGCGLISFYYYGTAIKPRDEINSRKGISF